MHACGLAPMLVAFTLQSMEKLVPAHLVLHLCWLRPPPNSEHWDISFVKIKAMQALNLL